MERGFKVRALGEIAIRCADLSKMAEFYQDIIGLEHLSGNDEDGIIFYKIAEGFGGHTSVLALFRPDVGRPEIVFWTKPLWPKLQRVHDEVQCLTGWTLMVRAVVFLVGLAEKKVS